MVPAPISPPSGAPAAPSIEDNPWIDPSDGLDEELSPSKKKKEVIDVRMVRHLIMSSTITLLNGKLPYFVFISTKLELLKSVKSLNLFYPGDRL